MWNRIVYTVLAMLGGLTAIYKFQDHLPFQIAGVLEPPSVKRQWKQIYAGVDGDQLYIDENNVVWIGGTIEYSEKIVWRDPRVFPGIQDVVSVESRLFVDCDKRTREIVRILVTRSDGTNVLNEDLSVGLSHRISTDPQRADAISSNFLCNSQTSGR